ncbi:hypothetical protein [Paraburkholderia xenovorans]|uniref:hypothetical protein n=1 Tax=Paraburkholderia xenovorans TaxID=36873 RepID=UPI00003C4181
MSVQGALTSGAATSLLAARDATVSGSVTSGDAVTLTAGRNLTLGSSLNANSDTALTATTGNLGVAGAITTVGNLTASAGGTLGLLGGALVNGDTTLTSTGTSTLTGDFYGLGLATINAGGSILGGGSLTFGKDIAITAGAGVTLGGIQGAGQLTATSGGDMSLGATTVVGNVTATSTGGSVAFNGALESGGNVQIQAAKNATVSGGISSMGTVNVKGTNGNVNVAGVSSNGDTTMSAGQTLTLSGTSTVAGEFALSGGNVTLSGTQEGSKNVTVSAQGTLDASQASLVSSQNMQLTGTNVTVGTAIVGGNLTAQASNQLSLVAGNVDVVGAASLISQNGLTNASNVLSGGDLLVSAPALTNTATGSLASTATTTIDATNFSNAGIVNGTTTNITVAGALTNVGGALMGLNALNINTGSLNNQNGLIFAGDPNVNNGPTTGNLSLTINGGNGSLNNAGGQLLAQDNLGLSAVNMALDPSQGTISQGGQLSITAGSISVGGTWNYGGAGVTLDGLNGITNSGTITGTTPLTMSTGGTFTNYGQVSGSDVTFNGTLYNVANAVLGASDALTINGNVTNRGTVQAGNALTVTGGTYDNQGAATQSQGNIAFNLSGTLLNTGGSIVAGNNISINAASVVNDQAAPSGATTTTTSIVDSAFLWTINIGTETNTEEGRGGVGGDGVAIVSTFDLTLGDLLAPTGLATNQKPTGGNCTNSGFCAFTTSQPVAGSGSVTFNEYSVQVGTDDDGGAVMQDLWFVGTAPDPHALASRTFTLPEVEQTTVSETPGTSGVISAGGSISLTAGSLSNQGGQIAAQGNVSLNVQSLSNGSVASNITNPATLSVNEAELSAFLSQLQSIGVVSVQGSYDGGQYANYVPWTTFSLNAGLAQTLSGTTTTSMPTGMVAAGTNLTIDGGNLVNAGLLYAGNNVVIGAQSLQNQGGNSQNFSTQVGCASGVPDADCGTYNGHTGGGPTTTTFSYSQSDATIYAGNDLVIAAGQINNTYGNLLAGHDIVIGGVGTTATSTTPAQSLNNTSGNIVAGNDINLNVSGAITNNLPPSVPVYQNFGSVQQYSGCMTAGGYKESYCGAYVDQQSGSSSVISAGNNLQINAGSLTNIGSLISAGTSATINVAGPVVNEAQTLNAYWHSEWVQETGDFSSDIRHNTWACGSVAECTALYGTAYTSVGGTIDPPTPVGNVAATIEAPNLSISSGGEIQNVGNVLGTSVSLTGQHLINGITTANTYTPLVSAPSQVISLSPLNMPGLNISVPGSIGTGQLPTPVAGQASYLEQTLDSQNSLIGPQQLLDALPASLQPSSTLFYYNPQEQALVLQQAALQQTGESSFVNTVPAASANGMSATNQQTAALYGNAVAYAEQNNIQLGTALTQTQINALTAPMLWYVEQTVPDPDCQAANMSLCPTVTALMPQVYLPANSTALSAGGNIQGQNVTLDFNQGGDGSILNTGSITASGTLTVNTDTLTNQANQVNVGQIWQYIDNTGYEDTTGTAVQPGGFMSAANMSLNVQTLNQIGGALQEINSDGTVSAAGTQQLLAQLQQQLGGNFTQTAESNSLNTSFTAEGGFGAMQVFALVAAVVASIVTFGAASAAIGTVGGATEAASDAAIGAAAEGSGAMATAAAEAGGTLMAATAGASAGLANVVLSTAIAGMVGSMTSQVIGTGSVNWEQVGESGLVSALTAGLTDGITFNGTNGVGFTTGATTAADPSLASFAGVQNLGSSIVPQAGQSIASNLPGEALALGADATIQAGVQSAIEGGSFLNALKNDAVSDVAAVGAYAIGNAQPDLNEAEYLAAHAALGCAASAAEGTGCAGGAIGGAASAAFSSDLIQTMDPSGAPLTTGQQAALAGFATLLGGGLAGLAGQNVSGGATAAQNEALNNDAGSASHTAYAAQNGGLGNATLAIAYSLMPWLPGNPATQVIGSTASSTLQGLLSKIQANFGGQTPPSDPSNQLSGGSNGNPPNTGASPVTTAGTEICTPEGCVMTPPTVAPGSPATPSNATLSSGNSGGGSGSASTGQGPAANTAAVTSEGAANSATLQGLKGQLQNENLANIAALDPRLAAAVSGSGTTNLNFSIGTGTVAEANALGQSWVGEGATLVSNQAACPGCLISADGTMIYRPPQPKSSQYATTGIQANFVRQTPSGTIISNGHLNVTP